MVVEWTVLIKAAGPVSSVALPPLKKWTLPWKVARNVRKRAKRKQLPSPPYWPLKKYLSEGTPLAAFQSGEPDQYDRVCADIKELGKPSATWPPDEEQSLELVALLLSEYTRSMTPNLAIETQVRSAIGELKQHHYATSSAASQYRGSFLSNLESLPPVRAMQARELRNQHPKVERVAFEIAQTRNRRQAFDDWERNHPDWLPEDEAPILTWFADLASDYNSSSAALLINRAVQAGATPASYWLTRAALLASIDHDQREAILPLIGEHPLADAVAAYLNEDLDEASQQLRLWSPTNIGESAFKAAVEYQIARAAGDQETMLRIAISSHDEFGNTSILLDYTKERLRRASRRESAMQFSDLRDCLELALELRDQRRRWGGDSAEAICLAVDASNLLADHEFALRITQLAPDGDAIPEEAQDASVLAKAAMSAAHFLEPNEIAAYRSRLGDDDPIGYQVDALTAQRNGDAEGALAAWQHAYERSDSPSEQLTIAYHLALAGRLPVELHGAVDPDFARQLLLINEAASSTAGQLEALITQARSSRHLAVAASDILAAQGRPEDAARLSEQVGERLSDAELLMMAARWYTGLGRTESAITAARTAIHVAPQHWGGRANAWRGVAELLAESGKWVEAGDAAAQYLALAPHNPFAQWALIICQAQIGDITTAHQTYVSVGRPLPQTEASAIVWIELWRIEWQSGESSLAEMSTVLIQWPDNSRVREAATRALVLSERNEDGTTDTQAVQTMLADLMEGMPDVFRQYSFDPDDPIAALTAIVSQMPDTSEMDSKIASGEFPLGVAATAFGRTYTELLVSKSGPVFTEVDIHSLRTPINWRQLTIVADISALHTLTLLPDLADTLLGYAGTDVQGVSAQTRDASRAVQELATQSTTTVGRSADGTPRVFTISDSEARTRHQRAIAVQQTFAKIALVDHLRIENIAEVQPGDQNYVWLTAVDRAISAKASLWCDDAWVRNFAESKGVTTFSTRQLIAGATADQILALALANIAEAQLLTRGYVPSEVQARVLEDAGQLTGWQPQSLVHAIAHASVKCEPEQLVSFAIRAMSKSSNDPESLADWTFAITCWLIRIAGTGTDRSRNVAVVLSRTMQEPWLNSTTLPFVLSGIRTAVNASGQEVEDPLKSALSDHYLQLAQRTNHGLAAAHVRALVALAAPADRVTAIGVVLATN